MSLGAAATRHRRAGGLAIPRGAVNGYGSAADFADTLGVNVHVVTGGNAYTNPSNIVSDVAAMGMRHVRADLIHGSWYSTVYVYPRALNVQIRLHNASLGGQQPIFITGQTIGWPPNHQLRGQESGNAGSADYPYTAQDFFDGMDAGRQHYGGAGHPPIANGTTSDLNATTPNPWNYNDAEVAWSTVAAVGGPNEPNDGVGLKAWNQQLVQQMRPHVGQAFGGLPAATTTGISSNVQRSQLPVIGTSIVNNGIANQAGDMSQGTGTADCGDAHPYHSGQMPSQEFVADWRDNTVSLKEAACYTGWYAGDFSRKLPFMVTEMGHVSRGVDRLGYPGSHSGHWPSPDDVCAEHLVREFVIHYLMGVRRTFVYELYDEATDDTAEGSFGLYQWDRTPKQQALAIRNLISLIGFSEAPRGAQSRLNITVSGFDTSGTNDQLGMYTGNGDFGVTGVGQAYHRSARMLHQLQLQTATEHRLILSPQVIIWDREPGNWNTSTSAPQTLANIPAGRKNPVVQNVTVALPPEVTAVSEATPTLMAPTSEAGRTWTPLNIDASHHVTVAIQGNTKVLRIL